MNMSMTEEQELMWDKLKHVPKGIEDDFIIEGSGSISYKNNSGNSYSVAELYAFLKDEMRKDELMHLPQPYLATHQLAPHVYTEPVLYLPSPLSPEKGLRVHLNDGSIIETSWEDD